MTVFESKPQKALQYEQASLAPESCGIFSCQYDIMTLKEIFALHKEVCNFDDFCCKSLYFRGSTIVQREFIIAIVRQVFLFMLSFPMKVK